jgi:hypothetical protein
LHYTIQLADVIWDVLVKDLINIQQITQEEDAAERIRLRVVIGVASMKDAMPIVGASAWVVGRPSVSNLGSLGNGDFGEQLIKHRLRHPSDWIWASKIVDVLQIPRERLFSFLLV